MAAEASVSEVSVSGASVSEAEFAVLARRAGLRLDDRQRATLYGVYGHLETMLERLRGSGDRARGAEPALVFVPGQEWPGQEWPGQGWP